MMHEPVYKTIYIGGMDALNPAFAELFDIPMMAYDAAVRLDKISILSSPTPAGMTALEIPIDDGQPVPQGVIKQVTDFMREHVQRERSVLVQCQAGISRSVTMVLAYLITHEQLSLLQAYQTVKAVHPGANPHPALIASLIEHFSLDIDTRRTQNPDFWQNLGKDAAS